MIIAAAADLNPDLDTRVLNGIWYPHGVQVREFAISYFDGWEGGFAVHVTVDSVRLKEFFAEAVELEYSIVSINTVTDLF